MPRIEELNSVASATQTAFRFALSAKPLQAHAYELSIRSDRIIPTRPDNLHDFMNALVWLTYPQLKATLNEAHCLAIEANPNEVKQRSAVRDALTLLDESGVLIFSEGPDTGHLLAQRKWRALFVDQRDKLLRHEQFRVVGHAILEKLLDPYPSITGKCLMVNRLPASTPEADHLGSIALHQVDNARQFPPLPVAGIPGWHPDNNKPGFYDNDKIFRPLPV